MSVTAPWPMHPSATSKAVFGLGGSESVGLVAGDALGKKIRKRRNLVLVSENSAWTALTEWDRYITAKHAHCTPICATPRIEAKHSKPLTNLQHPMSARLAGNVKIFAKAKVPDVVPSNTK